jgi:hypothetical protein
MAQQGRCHLHGGRRVPAAQHDEIEARHKNQRNYGCAQHGQTSDPTTWIAAAYLDKNYLRANPCARIF